MCEDKTYENLEQVPLRASTPRPITNPFPGLCLCIRSNGPGITIDIFFVCQSWNLGFRIFQTLCLHYCIFHVTYPTPQFELHSQPIFKTPLLTQFLMECLEILYIVFYIYYIGAPTTASSNSIFLIFRFFMPSPQGSTVIGRLLYKLERVWYPEKIHMYFSV